MKEVITAQEAGRILNIRGQAVREMIKRNIPPFDTCGCTLLREDRQRKQYMVMTRRMIQFYGIDEKTAEERMKK